MKIGTQLTVSRCPPWTNNTARTHLTSPDPLCALAPAPPPFPLPARFPLPSRSTEAVISGTANWGGRRLTVFWINVAFVWARHVSRSPESEECRACMRVRVNDEAGTVCGGGPSVCVVTTGAASISSSDSVVLCELSLGPPVRVVNLWPRLSSASSASSSPSTSCKARSSRIAS